MKKNLLKAVSRFTLCLTLCVAALAAVSCGDDDPVSIIKLELEKEDVTVYIGQSATVMITGGSGAYSVKSNDETIATASVSSATITIQGVAKGKATVRVSDDETGNSTLINVTVAEQGEVVLSTDNLTLVQGESKDITIEAGSGKYSLSIEDESIAVADMEGDTIDVLGVSGGETTLTVTDTETNKTATVEITVTAVPTIRFKTQSDAREITLLIDARAEDRDGVWIDLNGDGRRQADETVSFGQSALYPNNTEMTIYGKVTEFSCHYIDVTELDVSENPYLQILRSSSNPYLTSLDVTKNPELIELNVSNMTRLPQIDLTKNEKLEKFDCSNTIIETLDLSKCYELRELVCIMTEVKNIDFGDIYKVERINAWNNWFTELDVTYMRELTYLNVANNDLTDLNTNGNPKLKELNISNNDIDNINMQFNEELSVLRAAGCKFPTSAFLFNVEFVNYANYTVLQLEKNFLIEDFDFMMFGNVKEISMYKCNVNGEKMLWTVESLADRTGQEPGVIYIIDTSLEDGIEDQNVATVSQVEIAKAKNWKVMDYNSGSTPVEYAGSPDEDDD